MNFDEIKKLWRRCNHFIGPAYDLLPSEDKPCMEVYGPIFHNGSEVKSVYVNKAGELQDGPAQNHVELGKWLSRNEWMYRPYIGTSQGAGIAAVNYSDMVSLNFTMLDWLLWLNDLAASINRYIDVNRVAEDHEAKVCMQWWRGFVFFDPEKL